MRLTALYALVGVITILAAGHAAGRLKNQLELESSTRCEQLIRAGIPTSCSPVRGAAGQSGAW
jgi:hypothetical protein